MVRASSSVFRGGYYSHGKQFLENLPIPDIDFKNDFLRLSHNSIVSLVKKLIHINEKIKSSKIPKDRNLYERQKQPIVDRLNSLIESLYRLSPVDIEVAENVQILT